LQPCKAPLGAKAIYRFAGVLSHDTAKAFLFGAAPFRFIEMVFEYSIDRYGGDCRRLQPMRPDHAEGAIDASRLCGGDCFRVPQPRERAITPCRRR
jgi:hypothetical protein